MKLNTILADLEYYKLGFFPRKALTAAIANQEEITPILLKVLDDAVNDIDKLIDDPSYHFHIYAFYLLAQFREQKAYPLILKLFSLPNIDPYDFAGDFVTEALGRVLGSVYDGNIDLLKQTFQNEKVNEFVRSALSTTLLTLVAEEAMSREDALTHYQELFAFTCLHKSDSHDYLRSSLAADDILSLCPDPSLLDQIETALHDDLIDTSFINTDSIQRAKKLGVDAALKKLKARIYNRFIKDAIAEMEGWACFQKQDVGETIGKPLSPQEIWELTSFDQYEAPKSGGSSRKSKKKKSKSKKASIAGSPGFCCWSEEENIFEEETH